MSAPTNRWYPLVMAALLPVTACGNGADTAGEADMAPDAAEESAEPADPAPMEGEVSASDLDVTFGVTPDNQVEIRPAWTLDASGPLCLATRFTTYAGFQADVRREVAADQDRPVTVSFDPEDDETFLPRSENQGEFRWDVTAALHGGGCDRIPEEGAGEPLATWQGEVCLNRSLTGEWGECGQA